MEIDISVWAEEVLRRRKMASVMSNYWRLSDAVDPWKRNRDLKKARKLTVEWVNRHRDYEPGKIIPIARKAWDKWVSNRIKCGAYWMTYEEYIGYPGSFRLCILATDLARKMVLVCRRRRNHGKGTVARY